MEACIFSRRPPQLRCNTIQLSSSMNRCTLPCADTKVALYFIRWQLTASDSLKFFRCWFFWLVKAETEQKVNDDSVSWRSLLAMPASQDIDLVSWRASWQVTVREAKVQIIKWQKFHLAASVSVFLISCMLGHCHTVTVTGFFLIKCQNACWWARECIIW